MLAACLKKMISSAGSRMRAWRPRAFVIIGGGQMGLLLGYYLYRAKADFLILDAEDGPGGVLRHSWNSMRLLLPAGYSSLSTWLMPLPAHEGYPTCDDLLDLTDGTLPNNHQISVMAKHRRKPPVTTIKANTPVITQK